jgi:hypothetical protein
MSELQEYMKALAKEFQDFLDRNPTYGTNAPQRMKCMFIWDSAWRAALKTQRRAGTSTNSESSKSLCDYCGQRRGCQARAMVHNFISSCDGYTKA